MNNKFSWSNFDTEFLKSILRSEKTPKSKRPKYGIENAEDYELPAFVEKVASYPDRQFVLDYRQEIEFDFLKKNPQLVINVFGQKSTDNPNSLLNKVSKETMGEMLAKKYIVALSRIGCNDNEWDISEFTLPIKIDLRNTKPISSDLYDFQQDAVKALNNFVLNSQYKSGFLVMPTGSGKTRTAVHFLLHDMISQGYQVIWIAHRHLLLEQAAEQFKKFSGLIKDKNPDAKTFTFMCASSRHGTIKAASKKQDVIISSIQTASRNIGFINKALREKVVIVADESHHAQSRSYLKLINSIREKRPNALLLGLTATPVRYTDRETAKLNRLFEGNYIYQIGLQELINKHILSTPHFTKVETKLDFESGTTDIERKYIDKYGDMPPTLVNKIALSKQRNDIILKQYFAHDYKKTLIFALNIVHAKMLCDELQKRNVKCDCVYSGNSDNDRIIEAFKNDKLDVLINVNILTEGTDVPNINTVFLTRETQSESLLMQMIGRGMRGTPAGGTDTVEIVDFHDKWFEFSKWLDAKFTMGKYLEPCEDEEEKTVYKKPDFITIPWSKIRAAYRDMGSFNGKISESQNLPAGWYSLSKDDEIYPLLVFENQIRSYEKIIEKKESIRTIPNLSADLIINYFFSGMTAKPNKNAVEIFIDNLLHFEDAPSFFKIDECEDIDPYKVADKIKKSSLDLFKTVDEIYSNHHEVINELFGDLESYRERVFKIINYNASSQNHEVTEMPLELVPLKIDKPYDLNELYNEVKEEMAKELGECIYDTGNIYWSVKPYKSIFGRYFDYGDIEINCILNSSQVNREAVKYVLYHEMLHRKHWYHDKTFKTLEHKYPNYLELETHLDAEFKNFKIDY